MKVCIENRNFWAGKSRIGRVEPKQNLPYPENPDNPEKTWKTLAQKKCENILTYR